MRKVNRMIKFIIFVMLFTTTLSAKLISIGGRSYVDTKEVIGLYDIIGGLYDCKIITKRGKSFDVRRTCDEIYNILEKEDSGK